MPIKPDVIRVVVEFNNWKFEAIDEGKRTKITHTFALALGGSIPGVLVGKIHQ